MPGRIIRTCLALSLGFTLALVAGLPEDARAADSGPKRVKPRTIAKKHLSAKRGGRVRAGNGVELRVPAGVMRRSGKATIRRLSRTRYDVHIHVPWKGTLTVYLPLDGRRSLTIAHQTRRGWKIARGRKAGKRLRLRVRSLSAFDTNETMRYAIETVQLPYQRFLARKNDFTNQGCDAFQPKPGGCKKPPPYNRFNWTDDGCSPHITALGPFYRNVFEGPCKLHDFGYRNFGNGLALGRDESTRTWIDRRFREEMFRVCDTFSAPLQVFNKRLCQRQAGVVWAAVRSPAGAYAFYKPTFFSETPSTPAKQPVAPLPQGGSQPASPAAPTGSARRTIVVDNRVTNGMGMREDSSPARLLSRPWVYCTSRGCNIYGTERGSGGTYDAAVCQTFGERTTNGNDHDANDDANPARFASTRYYGVRLGDGTFGYVSEVWIRGDFRGGLGLPGC